MRFPLSLTTLTLGLVASATAEQTIKHRPDHEYDFVLKGEDVHARLSRDAQGGHHVQPEYLKEYQMRAKTVDPSSLGVDSVKQLSGYVDNAPEGKHLFFCKSCICPPRHYPLD